MRGARGRGEASATVLAALLVAQVAAAAELPRVFLAPGERAALTASRLAGRPPASAADSAAAATAPRATDPAAAAASSPAPRAARVGGLTFGAGAGQSVWIGGERIADGGYWAGHRVRVMRDGVRLVAPDGSVRLLRVGMTVRP